MLRGLTTVTYYADDVTAAARWYSEVLGIEPYFERAAGDRPAYLEFRLGDHQHELGILDSRFAPERPRTGGAIAHWHVDDIEAAFRRLLDLGATEYQKPVEHGPGFVTASVVDPFGNVLGVMFNQHYLEMLR